MVVEPLNFERLKRRFGVSSILTEKWWPGTGSLKLTFSSAAFSGYFFNPFELYRSFFMLIFQCYCVLSLHAISPFQVLWKPGCRFWHGTLLALAAFSICALSLDLLSRDNHMECLLWFWIISICWSVSNCRHSQVSSLQKYKQFHEPFFWSFLMHWLMSNVEPENSTSWEILFCTSPGLTVRVQFMLFDRWVLTLESPKPDDWLTGESPIY